MTVATSGIWNHAAAAQASPFASTNTSAKPMASSAADSSGDASSAGATITANDFLTLLVTEMQNQDPTADTDPNEYINQLVNVNSLEQLISINQTLSTAYPSTSSTSTTSSSVAPTQAHVAAQPSSTKPSTNGAHGITSAGGIQLTSQPIPVAGTGGAPVSINQGNLSASSIRPSALRVARSLDGQRITR
jgi:flagellar basal-body rod modification protein FlgD